MDELNFDEIRCFNNQEAKEVLAKLIHEPQFVNLLTKIFSAIPIDQVKSQILSFNTVYEFQEGIVYVFLKNLETKLTKGIDMVGLEKIDTSKAQLYISNHRDIILDSAFLCIKLIDNKLDTVEIAIGDNLLVYPWIENLVRVNKSFIVKRGLSARQILESSKTLSAYINHTITKKNQSVWIAQREGRAKDSNDRTQESLLKMFNMFGKGSFYENMMNLNICPLSISYEYDPCDYLKAKEFQLKRDNPEYVKTQEDDLTNMRVGMMGYKGKVVYAIAGNINKQIESLSSLNKNEQISATANLIDKNIHANYSIFPINMIAYDRLLGISKFVDRYSPNDISEFDAYFASQMDKIDLPYKDQAFLTIKMLEMYANPLINKLKAEDAEIANTNT
jgi:Acyltransferase